jgi:2-amino-4-hydroxy-6-hydroxymethyldihydropteridine diphosphokinase
MSAQPAVFIAIGSNIEPRRHIPRCLGLLGEIRESSLAAESSWYRTRPWGIADQPEFINLVVRLDTRLSPRELLRETQAIETSLDRVRTLKNGPRTLDLDILLFGERVVASDDLAIPHPGLLLRDFMLLPLIEIAPEAIHPVRRLPVKLLQGEIRYRQIMQRIASESI